METDFPSFVPSSQEPPSESDETTSQLAHIWNGYVSRAPATILAVLEDLAEHSHGCVERGHPCTARDGGTVCGSSTEPSQSTYKTGSSQRSQSQQNSGICAPTITSDSGTSGKPSGSTPSHSQYGTCFSSQETSPGTEDGCVKCYLHDRMRDELSLYSSFRINPAKWKERELRDDIETCNSRLLGMLHNCLKKLNATKHVVSDNRQTPCQGESLHPGRVHEDVLQRICSITGLRPNDLFIDIGSGDGYAVLALAAISGCHAIGIEVIESRFNLSKKVAETFSKCLRQLYENWVEDSTKSAGDGCRYWPNELSNYHQLSRILLSLQASWELPGSAHPDHLRKDFTGLDADVNVPLVNDYLFSPYNNNSRRKKQKEWRESSFVYCDANDSRRPHLNDVVLDIAPREDMDFLKSALTPPSSFNMPQRDGSSSKPKFGSERKSPITNRINTTKRSAMWREEMPAWRARLIDAVQRAGDLSLEERVLLISGDVIDDNLPNGLAPLALSHCRVVFCNNFDGRWLADRFQDRLILKLTRYMCEGSIVVSCYPIVRMPRMKTLTHTVQRGGRRYLSDSYTTTNLYFVVHGGIDSVRLEDFKHHSLCECLLKSENDILSELSELGFTTPFPQEVSADLGCDAVIGTAQVMINRNPTRHKSSSRTATKSGSSRTSASSESSSDASFSETDLMNLALDICYQVWINGHNTLTREELSRSIDKHSQWPSMPRSLPYYKRKPEVAATPARGRSQPSAYHHLPWMSVDRQKTRRHERPDDLTVVNKPLTFAETTGSSSGTTTTRSGDDYSSTKPAAVNEGIHNDLVNSSVRSSSQSNTSLWRDETTTAAKGSPGASGLPRRRRPTAKDFFYMDVESSENSSRGVSETNERQNGSSVVAAVPEQTGGNSVRTPARMSPRSDGIAAKGGDDKNLSSETCADTEEQDIRDTSDQAASYRSPSSMIMQRDIQDIQQTIEMAFRCDKE
eukprot:gb/GECG01007981.1/.p1 GENE.gb/GECG01007981.1/~~gb/GECG01007981.1/.p1  ORF type:complete len:969 (+),score=95.47 gb/GECG01007981.1/:1-2907(+)